MRRLMTRVVVHVAVIGALLTASATPALAAGPGRRGGGGGGAGSVPVGNDISYPQCGTAFPASPAFGIVGLNGGLANDLNPCLGPSSSYPSYASTELYWAVADSIGGTSQPEASLYLNTADPGNVYNGSPVADWPASGSTPYGACTTTTVTASNGSFTVGENSPACAWQYGYDRATQDVIWLTSAANAIDAQEPPVTVAASASGYPWWLDVETANTWQSGAAGQAMNTADLQGMVAALQQAGAPSVGAYSTASVWDAVTGGTAPASGSLYQIPDWIPGARTQSKAESNCGLASFTGGTVTLTQWTSRHQDNDYAC